ncbi:MAG: chemotaxis-specific protein-glutamate methyltransferase CheB [Lentisphaeria bacterium]
MRIGLVNDVAIALEALRRVVASCPEHTVAWMARDGAEAVRCCAADPPDVILMDLIMPVMDGVEATRHLVHAHPECAILVVTATVEGHLSRVFEAMGAGALDAVNTPVLGAGGALVGGAELLRKIAIVGRLSGVGGRGAAPSPRPPPKGAAAAEPAGSPPARPWLVAVASSTGGPAALAALLGEIPASCTAAIVVVQHVDVRFAPDLALWLGGHCRLPVRTIVPGMHPEPGAVLLAATNDHLWIDGAGALSYRETPRELFYRPSADVFFRALAAGWPTPGAAVVLTGMGRDGAEGLLALRQAGWWTAAQDAASSVVHGMPGAAIELGAAGLVLPPAEIGRELARLL